MFLGDRGNEETIPWDPPTGKFGIPSTQKMAVDFERGCHLSSQEWRELILPQKQIHF